jgi:hypothetical protein
VDSSKTNHEVSTKAGQVHYEFECETSLVPEAPPKDLHKCFDLRVNNEPQKVGPGTITDKPGYKALVLKHKVTIPAGGQRFFEASFETVRRLRDAEILMTTWPSDGVTVTVISPSGLDVVVNSLHPDPVAKVPTGKNSCKWTLAGAMVPGQGIFIAWEPKIGHVEGV